MAYADTIDEINREASAIVSAKIVLLPVCLIAYAALIKVSGVFFESPIAPPLVQLCLLLILIRTHNDLWIVLLIQAQALLTSILLSVMIMRREGPRLRTRVWSSQVAVALRGAKTLCGVHSQPYVRVPSVAALLHTAILSGGGAIRPVWVLS